MMWTAKLRKIWGQEEDKVTLCLLEVLEPASGLSTGTASKDCTQRCRVSHPTWHYNLTLFSRLHAQITPLMPPGWTLAITLHTHSSCSPKPSWLWLPFYPSSSSSRSSVPFACFIGLHRHPLWRHPQVLTIVLRADTLLQQGRWAPGPPPLACELWHPCLCLSKKGFHVDHTHYCTSKTV